MKNKTDSDDKTPERTFLVVDADEDCAEALRAELASRGLVVSVHRAETPDEAASDAALAESDVKRVLRSLTTSEIKVLNLLLRNAGDPVSRKAIYRELYGGPGPLESRAPDQMLRRLRAKLGLLGRHMANHRGVGIRWDTDHEVASGFTADRLLQMLAPFRAAILALFLVAAFSAGWFLRPGARGGGTGTGSVPTADSERIPPPPPAVEAQVPSDGTIAAPGHGPECAVDGNPDTWFQTDGPARKRDMLFVLYDRAVRGTLVVQCGVPGSTNAPPAVGVGVSYPDDLDGRRLGFVDPATGLFSGDIGEKPADRIVLVVAADSDEPFAVQSVRVDP